MIFFWESHHPTRQALFLVLNRHPLNDLSNFLLILGLNLYMENDFNQSSDLFTRLVRSNPDQTLKEGGLYWTAQSNKARFPTVSDVRLLVDLIDQNPFIWV